MRERPNRMVSKTIVAQVTVGSNPTPSARYRTHEPRPENGPGFVRGAMRSALESKTLGHSPGQQTQLDAHKSDREQHPRVTTGARRLGAGGRARRHTAG